MFFRNKSKTNLEIEQHELLENAQRRIQQKKRLYSHFVIFLIGSVFLVLINKILKYGQEYDWFIWVITFWAFLFILHIFNVFITHKFMGKDWERAQREKLVAKQKKRITKMEQEINKASHTVLNTNTTFARELILIAAASEDNALGKDNDLLWHLPDDFKRFKKLTIGHKIIMGRKTFESFPKPLPKRTHIIITRDKNYSVNFENCIIVHSLEQALQLVDQEKAFVIGGGEIYKQAEPFADTIELTRVHTTYPDADTFFPEINEQNWKLINKEHHTSDERHKFAFSYLTYKKG